MHWREGVTVKLVALILLLASFTPAWAQQDIAMQVNVGFNDYYKVGEWVPVTVVLENPGGKDIAGELVVEITESTGDSVYSKPVILPPNSKKKYTLYVLIRQYKSALKVELHDGGGRLIAEEEKALRPSTPGIP